METSFILFLFFFLCCLFLHGEDFNLIKPQVICQSSAIDRITGNILDNNMIKVGR